MLLCSQLPQEENNTISVPCTGVMAVGVNKGYFVFHGLNKHRMFFRFLLLGFFLKKREERMFPINQCALTSIY